MLRRPDDSAHTSTCWQANTARVSAPSCRSIDFAYRAACLAMLSAMCRTSWEANTVGIRPSPGAFGQVTARRKSPVRKDLSWRPKERCRRLPAGWTSAKCRSWPCSRLPDKQQRIQPPEERRPEYRSRARDQSPDRFQRRQLPGYAHGPTAEPTPQRGRLHLPVGRERATVINATYQGGVCSASASLGCRRAYGPPDPPPLPTTDHPFRETRRSGLQGDQVIVA
jgi:hypothetical protein